jgi:tetratricopeptide (TPR) repeat protein
MAYVNRGFAYANKGELYHTISDSNKAIELNPNLAMAYVTRGGAFLDLDRPGHGCGDLHKACQLGFCEAMEWAKQQRLCQ